MKCAKIHLRIDPAKVHLLKFILEGYDGLAVVTTEDPARGSVVVSVPPGRKEEAEGVILRVFEELDLGPKG